MPAVDEYGRVIPDAPVGRAPPPGAGWYWGDESTAPPGSVAVPLPQRPMVGVRTQPPTQQGGRAQPTAQQQPAASGGIRHGAGYDPNMVSTESDADQLSPTAMIIRYLAQQGQRPTAENISRALQANALDPGQRGPFMISDSSPGGTQLRNTQVEDSAPARAMAKAVQPARWDLTEPDARWDVPGKPPGLRDARPIISNKTMPPPGPGEPMELPKVPLPTLPPESGAPVSPGGQPQMPPPTPGAAVARPMPPTDPLGNAITQALEPPRIGGPSPQLALPAPEAPVRPAIAGPPPVPQIEAAPRPLALPAPEAPRALPAPDLPTGNFSQPQGEPGGRVQVGKVTPKAAPGKPVQGYPIEQTPLSRGAGRVMSGIAGGAARGGIPGAIVGGAASAAGPLIDALGPSAKELVPYIMKNLHLQ